MKLILTTVLIAALAAPAMAKPPLRDVAEIDDQLMMMGIADEIRKKCSGIDARMFRALGMINDLKNSARSMGYSRDEVNAYVSSKSEKKRMRTKATSYLESKGVNAKSKSELCKFGKDQMKRKTTIGSLLR